MSITQANTHYPPMGRLWTIDDIAAYAVGQDASAVVKMSGFPRGMKLDGIGGQRWFAAHIVRFFERLSDGDLGVDFIEHDDAAAVVVPVLPRMELGEFKAVA